MSPDLTLLNLAVQERGDQVVVTVRVVPRASRTAIAGFIGEGAEAAIKVALAAPPVDGKANEALILFVAGLLDIPRRDVAIVSGMQSRLKRIAVAGLGVAQVRTKLQAALA